MIKIEINDRELKIILNKIQKKADNMKPVMVAIANSMLEAVEENFEKEGRPKWQPLSQRTIQQRITKKRWPGKILQQTGQLLASIQPSATNESATVSTNKIYAAIHHFGGYAGKNRKVKIPARPFMQLTEEDVNNIKKLLLKHFL